MDKIRVEEISPHTGSLVQGLDLSEGWEDATMARRHPLIIRHPVTGRRAIYASGTAFAIDGMPADEGRALIQRLRAHVAEDQFRITWKVAPGDIVLWDNFSTVHSATPIDYSDLPGKQRLLYRISTRGLPDLCRAPAQ